jgi:PAS domain S-box-containing protein
MMEKDFTDKKKIQQLTRKVESLATTISNLKKSEQLLSNAVDFAPIGMITLTTDGNFTSVNKAFRQITGYTKKELLTLNISQITHPDDKHIGDNVIRELISGKAKDAKFEKRYIHKNGHTIYAQVSTAIINDELGIPQNFFTQVIDDTSRKLSEQALRKSEEQLHLITENTSDNIAITTFDLKATYIFVNPSVKSLLGYDPKDLIGKSFFDFIHPDDKKVLYPLLKNYVNQKIKKLLTGKETTLTESIEYRFKNKVGNWRYLQSTINIADKHLLSISRDVTDLRMLERDAFDWKKRYESAIIATGNILYDWDSVTNEVVYGGSIEQTIGYTFNEMKGGLSKWIELIHQDDREYFNKAIERLIKTKKSAHLEYRIQKKDGKYITIEDDGQFIEVAGGEISRMIGFVRDITSRKKTEELLKTSEARHNEAQRIAHIGTWELDLISNTLYWSDEIYTMFELKPQQFDATYEAFLDNIHPDDRELVNSAYTESLKNKLPYNIVHRLLLKDKSIKYVREHCETFYDDKGKAIRSIGTVQDITKRKEIEETLVKSEEKYKSVVEGSNDLIFMVDNEGIVLQVNHAAANIFRRKRNEIEGENIYKLFPKKIAERFKSRLTKVFKTGKNATYESTMPVGDSEIWINTSINPIRDNDGNVIAVMGISRNIDQHKKAEKLIKESEEKYKDLVEKAGIAILMDDRDGNLTYFNKRFAELYGYSDQEISQMNLRDIIYQADIKNVIKFHNDRLAGKKVPTRYEFRGIKKDGSVIYLETDVVLLKSNNSAIGTRSYVWDITERKQSEEALLNSEQNFRLLAENSIDCIWTMDKKLNFTYLSPALKNIMGFEPHEWVGTNLSSHFKKKEFLKAGTQATKALKNFKISDSVTFESKMLNNRNKEIDVEISGRLLLNNEGKVIGLQGITKAIAVRKKTEDEILTKSKELHRHYEDSEQQRVATISVLSDLNSTTKRLQEEIDVRKKSEDKLKDYRNHLEELVSLRTAKLEEANKELEAFSYSVSHDLRAPLRAIDGFTRILIEDYASKLDQEGNRLGSIIQRNAQKMGHLIDDLLAFSRLGRATMTITKIDMTKIVNNIYQEATNKEERKRIKFSIADLPQIHADAKMMRQVWVNLISNAIKFTSYRKRAIITITCKEEKEKLTYCIKDNGAGFDMKYGDKLFGVFQRLHGENEFEGTGVGLALIQRIIKRYDGDVWAEGKVDKGASFYFSLPKIRKGK